MKWLLTPLLLLALSSAAPAKEAVPLAQNAATELRLNSIAEELRCLVCQNESLAASRADLAEDLRREIREQIQAGKSDQQIVDYMVARYGDFVRYRPPVKPVTYVLWFGPLLLIVGGAGLLLRHIQGRRKQLAALPPLSAADQARAQALLGPTSEEKR